MFFFSLEDSEANQLTCTTSVHSLTGNDVIWNGSMWIDWLDAEQAAVEINRFSQSRIIPSHSAEDNRHSSRTSQSSLESSSSSSIAMKRKKIHCSNPGKCFIHENVILIFCN